MHVVLINHYITRGDDEYVAELVSSFRGCSQLLVSPTNADLRASQFSAPTRLTMQQSAS